MRQLIDLYIVRNKFYPSSKNIVAINLLVPVGRFFLIFSVHGGQFIPFRACRKCTVAILSHFEHAGRDRWSFVHVFCVQDKVPKCPLAILSHVQREFFTLGCLHIFLARLSCCFDDILIIHFFN